MVLCSLSAVVATLRPKGFELLHLAFHEAVFVDARLLNIQVRNDEYIMAQWLGGYYCHPLRLVNQIELVHQATFLYDYRRWSDLLTPVKERVELIRKYLDFWGQ